MRRGTFVHAGIAVGSLASVLVHVRSGFVLAALATVVTALVAASIDRTEHRIPNPVVLSGAGVLALVVPVAGAIDARPGDAVIGALLGALCYAAPLLLLHLASPAGIGFGDVKLGAVIGAGLGAGHVVLAPIALVAACAVGIGRRLVLRRLREPEPFAPPMAAGACLVLLVARPLVDALGFRWFG